MNVKEFHNYIESLVTVDIELLEQTPFLDALGLSVKDGFDCNDVLDAIKTELNSVGHGGGTQAFEYDDFVICVCERGPDAWKNFCVALHENLPHLPEMYDIELDESYLYITKYYEFLESSEYRVDDWTTISDVNIRVPLETLYSAFGYHGKLNHAYITSEDIDSLSSDIFESVISVLELIHNAHTVLNTLYVGMKYISDKWDTEYKFLDCLPCNLCYDDDDETLLLYDVVGS